MPTTQNISMTDELAAFVTDQVKSGDFSSVSEVYREALRGYRDRVDAQKQYRELVTSKIEESKRAYANGDYVTLNTDSVDGFMDSITDELDAKHA